MDNTKTISIEKLQDIADKLVKFDFDDWPDWETDAEYDAISIMLEFRMECYSQGKEGS